MLRRKGLQREYFLFIVLADPQISQVRETVSFSDILLLLHGLVPNCFLIAFCVGPTLSFFPITSSHFLHVEIRKLRAREVIICSRLVEIRVSFITKHLVSICDIIIIGTTYGDFTEFQKMY